jgi:PRTRC genetic system ThiF family protein
MKPIKSFRIEIGEVQKFNIYLVGCGGTGSFCALHLARLAYVAAGKGIKIDLTFIDPDHVELGNIGRQNFIEAEIGQAKAVALARRYSYAFGLQIQSRVEPFKAGMVQPGYRELALVIGCVDNAAARRELANVGSEKRVWWLDSGNSLDSGQVLIGNARKVEIDPTGFATSTPRPSVQEPSLLADEPQAASPTVGTQAEAAPPASCAELLAQEVQSLMINQAMAGIVATYAFRLIMGRDLDVMATYINLGSLSMRSVAITGEAGKIEAVKEEPALTGMELAGMIHALDWDEGELLEIADGGCPECQGQLVEGRDTVDEEETDIVFCPYCHWIMAVDDLRARLAQAAEELDPERAL